MTRARFAREVDFVGLGQMGFAMAANLVSAGFTVRGADIAPDRRAAAEERGIPCEDGIAALGGGARCVALCLPGPDDVLAAVESIAARPAPARPRYVLNLSTIGPRWALEAEQRLRDCSDVVFVEAPVTGGVLRTARREIALLCGCRDPELADPLRPVLDAIAQHVVVFGSVRDASVAKLVNNVAAVNIALGTIEALSLGAAAGLDVEALFEVLDAGTAGSYVLSSTLRRSLVDGDLRTGFAMRLARKDMRLALDQAESLEVDLPYTAEALAQLEDGIDAGLGDLVFPAVALQRGVRSPVDREVIAV